MAKHYLYQHPLGVDEQDLTRRLELHWARESQTVMLGSTRWQGQPGEVATDREYLDSENDHEPPLPAWDGPLIELQRSQINHLIKQLRAARDQAYGKDE
jgi:hypothetical protein